MSWMIQVLLANQLSSPACENSVKMISCGADKSIYFRTAHKVRHVPIDVKHCVLGYKQLTIEQDISLFLVPAP